MSKEFCVDVIYKKEVADVLVTDAELDLIASVLPELVLLVRRFDDSDED